MNPSIRGWVKKFLNKYHLEILRLSKSTFTEHYNLLKKTGFIYGTNLSTLFPLKDNNLKLTQEELSKVNLLNSLAIIFYKKNPNSSQIQLMQSIIFFYQKLNQTSKPAISLKIKRPDLYDKLETIFHQRIQTNENFIQKNFSNIVTNALLFVDVLAYSNFLNKNQEPSVFIEKLEQLIVNTFYVSVKDKKLIGKYDKLVIKLIQRSLRFYEVKTNHLVTIHDINFKILTNKVQKKYILDMICMTLYSDEYIDKKEIAHIKNLTDILELEEEEIYQSTYFIEDFVHKNRAHIYYFNNSNPIKQFFDKTHRTVNILLHRNKKRIQIEIYQSKELFNLLILSTHKELSKEQKRKVKEQLKDIFMTIPSLTIFALPGGTLLLPIIIKIIPSLLPSSFNENLKKN